MSSNPGTPGGVQTALIPQVQAAVTPKPSTTLVPINSGPKQYKDDEIFGATETVDKFPDFDYSVYQFPDMNEPCAHPSKKITFTKHALYKLLYFLHKGDTEVGGFGITTLNNPLHIVDFHLLPQECSAATTDFNDTALARYLDHKEAVTGLTGLPAIWMHTHPGNSPNPSSVDETCFKDKFAPFNWSVMFIMAKGHQTYARIQNKISEGLNISSLLEVDFDIFSLISASSELVKFHESWDDLYTKAVKKKYATTVYHTSQGAWRYDGYTKTYQKNPENDFGQNPGGVSAEDFFDTEYYGSSPVGNQGRTSDNLTSRPDKLFGADPAKKENKDGKWFFDTETQLWLPSEQKPEQK